MESARRVFQCRPVLGPVVLRKATCSPSVAARIKPYKVVGQHATTGWGMISFGAHRFDLVPTIVVVTSLLLLVGMIWTY